MPTEPLPDKSIAVLTRDIWTYAGNRLVKQFYYLTRAETPVLTDRYIKSMDGYHATVFPDDRYRFSTFIDDLDLVRLADIRDFPKDVQEEIRKLL